MTELIEAIIFLMKRKNKFNLYLLGPKDSGISVKKISFLIKKIFNSNKKIIFQKQSFGWIGDVQNIHIIPKDLMMKDMNLKIQGLKK